MRRRVRALGAMAMVLGTACEGLQGPIGERRDVPPERGGTLELANYSDVRSLDPAVAFDQTSIPFLQLLFTPLVDYAPDGRIVPLLAERVDVASDGLRHSFKLREGVLFHDGQELTADDVKRSIERALDPETPCPSPSFYASIAGYSPFHDGVKDPAGKVAFAPHLAGVVVEGRYALRIDLSEPDATFLPALTLYFLAPVCRSGGSKYARDWNSAPCGSGPFRLQEWSASREITLRRHDGYFDPGLPYLDGIRWSLLVRPLTQRFKFEKGELDHLRQLHANDLRAYRGDPRWQPFAQWEPAKGTEAVFLNTQMPPFDKVELRRAFAAAVDWKRVVAAQPDAVAATQMLPPAVAGHDPGFVGQTYDREKALAHMRRAGYPFDPATGRGGYPEPVTFVAPTDTAMVENFAPILQQQLAKIGIRMRIKQVSYPAYLAETSRRNRVALGYGGWSMDFPDASDFFEPTLSSDAIQEEETQNRAFFADSEFDALLKRAHHELDPLARAAMYRRCEEIVRDQVPWAIGFHQRWYELVQPYVHGYAVDAKHTEDMRAVWIDAGARTSGRDLLAVMRPWGRR
ncbi:MAG TPA: ABC transporter substrate-binding protein [Polyangiaceae bacterium]|nr:ABC transporter substrate-binding protein [Polyangiaceae bacterium]